MQKIRLLIADDHHAFREGLARLLVDQDDMEVIAQAGDGIQAVEMASQLLPDVAVVEVALPTLTGIEVTRRIKAASPSTAVLLLSHHDMESHMLAAIEAGASGYLSKKVQVRDLVACIRTLYAGELVLDRTAGHRLFHRLATSSYRFQQVRGQLHEREFEVLKLTAKGMTNKAIASALRVSERTVQTHLAHIFVKLDVQSRTEAVLHALKEGWLDIDDLS